MYFLYEKLAVFSFLGTLEKLQKFGHKRSVAHNIVIPRIVVVLMF